MMYLVIVPVIVLILSILYFFNHGKLKPTASTKRAEPLINKELSKDIPSTKLMKTLSIKQNELFQCLNDLKELKEAGKRRSDKKVKLIEKHLMKILQIDSRVWFDESIALSEIIDCVQEYCSDTLASILYSSRNEVSSEHLLTHASGGRALQGVLLLKSLNHIVTPRKQLIKTPEIYSFSRLIHAQPIQKISKFNSLEAEAFHKDLLVHIGYKLALMESSSPRTLLISYAGMEIPCVSSTQDGILSRSIQDQQPYSSTVLQTVFPKATLTYEIQHLKLTGDAIQELHKIQIEAEKTGPRSPKVLLSCIQFFQTFGSHVCCGPFSFGGIHWIKCSCSANDGGHEDFIEKTYSMLQIVPSLKLNAINHITPSATKLSDGDKQNEMSLEFLAIGGCANSGNIVEWCAGVALNSYDWQIVDCSDDYKPIWDIVALNHTTDLDTTLLADALNFAFHQLQTNPNIEKKLSFLEYLDLIERYTPSYQLSMHHAMSIRESTLDKNECSDPKKLMLLLLQKIMSQDSRSRNNLLVDVGDHEEMEFSIQSASLYAEDISCQRDVHPMDSFLALFLCSDPFLRQDMMVRLASCQLSIPIITVDPVNQDIVFQYWAASTIIKSWKRTDEKQNIIEVEYPILDYPAHIVSFIRLGTNRLPLSKSKALNAVLSRDSSNYNHFFHRDCDGGTFPRVLSEGLVDMCWYLPGGKTGDVFPDALTFLNLHGNACDHLKQVNLLYEMTSLCFVFIGKENIKKHEIELISKFSSCIILLTAGIPENINEIAKNHIIKLFDKNEHATKAAIQKTIVKNLKFHSATRKCITSYLENVSMIEIKLDKDNEQFRKGEELAKALLDQVENTENAKKKILPLQGKELWQKWAQKDKEQYRQVMRGSSTVEKYALEMETAKKEIRMEQRKHIDNLNPLIVEFISSVQNPDKFVVSYFLKCLNNGLNGLSRSTIGSLQNQYQNTRRKLALLQAKHDLSPHSTTKSDEEVKTQKELDALHQQLIDNSFGLEHILREIGQVYETAIDLREQEQFVHLPDLASLLLINGYPLEVMDGDAAHLPKRWVQAVLKRTNKALNDPRIFILSVLGLQSTGKSTMLNAVFGLQFTVSSGRCTRGAYMQLVPISEELKASGLECDYILVLDTEGLRAPELDPEQTQKHDNELATFVIGIADTTLINIYGEVPGEMDNILQTAVHAFIRMKKVKLKPSCQFVHQNAGASSKTDMGQDKFTQKLNHMTIEAAKEEGCAEGEFERFNSVIKFDDQKDVHHFTSLWMGDPPMAPVNHGYSQDAQLLKKALISIIKETKCSHLETFQQKLGDLWNALLHERFVFSFKNTMEITAYNSLEAEYNRHRLKFKDEVMKWQEKTANAIDGAPVDALQNIENIKINGFQPQSIQRLVQDLKSQYEKELKKYFEISKQAEIIIQWQATFIQRLTRLAEDLLTETSQHCMQLIKNKRLKAGVRNEKEQYKLRIISGVKELVENLKKEREELEKNIESGNATNEQLEKIIAQKLMSRPNLLKYKDAEIISSATYKNIICFVAADEQPLTIQKLKSIFDKLTSEEIFLILKQGRLTDAELEKHFAIRWKKLLSQLPEHNPQNRDIVEVTVQRELIQHFEATHEGSVSDTWAAQSSIELHFEVKPDSHVKKSRSYMKKAIGTVFGGNSITSEDIRQAQQISESVLNTVAEFLKFHKHRSIYNAGLINSMLKCLDESYKRIIDDTKNQLEIKFTSEHKVHLYVVACKYAVVYFQEMVDDDNRKNDPRVWLEEEIKDQLLTSFKNQYHRIAHEEAVATTLCDPMVRIVLKQLKKTLGRLIGNAVGTGVPYFSTKVALKVKIMTDLAEDLQASETEDFTPYIEYLTDVKSSMMRWVKHYIARYCKELAVNKTKTNFMHLASQKVNELIKVISITAENVTSSFQTTLTKVSTRQWIETFCTNSTLIESLGDTAMLNVCGLHEHDDGTEQQLELESFHTELTTVINKARQIIIQRLPGCGDMNQWETSPEEFLKHITGCLAQCPFCGEPCDRDQKHCDIDDNADSAILHSASDHRQTCIIGYKFSSTGVMAIEACSTLVESDKTFKNSMTEKKNHPYKEYKTIYPLWHIPADRSMEASLYWKWLVAHYHHKLEEHYNMEPAEIPEEWTNLKWPDVKKNLLSHYNL